MTASAPSFPHRLRRALTHVVALGYLALCAALLLWAVAVHLFGDAEGSMAGVIPILATAPGSLLVLMLPTPDGIPGIVLTVAFGALLNAAVIGWCARALTRGTA
ncbi:hypothetical protein PS467_35265 [Streptomyces luomodiensis]|uniref:Integral membrane protein n=1 Tax=Streptomyces luomodiensis TaxID=3026192 RepID=A0ABY9V5P7_9ACTN|nr:hypothetical protein [Streptomyces sp. SCA4-21]WNF00206.1 hypothetical protein PS467_35265 [Streptomyces sp. SCA4-21]